VHPINTLVGGFGRLPSHSTVDSLRRDLAAVKDPLLGAVELVSSIDVPDWAAHETLFAALRPIQSGFGFRGEEICTSAGAEYPVHAYREAVREFSVEHSTARHAALESGDTYMVGSLARLELWGDRLDGAAAETFNELLPDGAVDNVLMNTRAQVVETVYCVESAIAACEAFLAFDEVDIELQEVEGCAGRGLGAIEAPRGTLIHEYELDDEGMVVAANVVTPTAQNLANIERDLRHSGDRLQETSRIDDAVLKRGLEMVVRAYDPCISCSVHLVRVDG
jgi:sulfhydrogenase subunit alpha